MELKESRMELKEKRMELKGGYKEHARVYPFCP